MFAQLKFFLSEDSAFKMRGNGQLTFSKLLVITHFKTQKFGFLRVAIRRESQFWPLVSLHPTGGTEITCVSAQNCVHILSVFQKGAFLRPVKRI